MAFCAIGSIEGQLGITTECWW